MHPTHTVLEPVIKDLGGFSVKRMLPHAQCAKVGPWIFFDHMGPAVLQPGPGLDVRPHPHMHLATVTYLWEGEVVHRDSLGTVQTIVPGDLNIMVAGRGIVHSERESEAQQQRRRRAHGLQLWLALPDHQEDTDPSFTHYPSNRLPTLDVEGARVRVLIGRAYGGVSPVRTHAPALYVEAHLPQHGSLVLPEEADERCVYVVSGALEVEGVALPAHQMMVCSHGSPVQVRATQDTQLVVLGGGRLSHRYVVWNFASSRLEAIEQAKADWSAGRRAVVPGDEDAFIPLPDHLR